MFWTGNRSQIINNAGLPVNNGIWTGELSSATGTFNLRTNASDGSPGIFNVGTAGSQFLGVYTGSHPNVRLGTNSVTLGVASSTRQSFPIDGQVYWTNNAVSQGWRVAIIADGVVNFRNVAGTAGDYAPQASLLTAGTMTQTTVNRARTAVHRYDWTNAMVVALGATTTGNITVATLPAKTVVKNAYVVITGAAAGPATVTVSLGRTGADYIDYVVASDAKAAANTVYGDASGERGTNLTNYDMPSFTGTTDVVAQFISSGANLDTVTGSTGTIYLETYTLP